MKNIHLIPTDKPSRLRIGNNGNFVLGLMQSAIISKNDSYTNQNIYITSDEEFKMGDWVYSVRHFVGKFGFFENSYQNECKKIILTTDQYLIKDGVQAIEDEFLEWFVKNPSCEEVETYSLGVTNQLTGESGHYKYEIIIPSEENSIEAKQRAKNYMSLKGALEPKQETLEQAAEKYAKQFDYAEDSSPNIDFIEGAKWQAEKMYSEEELREAFKIGHRCARQGSYNDITEQEDFNKWFEQFKKK